MTTRQITFTILCSLLSALVAVGLYRWLVPQQQVIIRESAEARYASQQDLLNGIRPRTFLSSSPTSFTEAASKITPAVVFIRSYQSSGNSFLRRARPEVSSSSGSGVIISSDGYIVTNNHVVEGGQRFEVTLSDKREFTAEIIGTDPSTDLALLRIEETKLPNIEFGNSDSLLVGEWVLAVGNPFNLTSTVTAGIISAKGRNINIINDQSAIESFIQTDAAVNPGNSGGALVNTRGELIGINTAISTHTGSFEGYSFAVPSNIVSKVVADLRKYGAVQRAFLGVNITDVSAELAKEQKLKTNAGVYIIGLVEDGAAQTGGIQKGDIIISEDGAGISKTSELLEQIGRKRPGDKAKIAVIRGSEQKTFDVTLRNQKGTTQLFSKDEILSQDLLGATYSELNDAEKKRYGLQNGIKVTDPGNGKLKQAGVPKDFIIVKVNNQFINSTTALNNIINNLGKGDGVLIQGYHPSGHADYFAFGL